eukprot:365415-Chlamydomonas_euryale.AAC.3
MGDIRVSDRDREALLMLMHVQVFPTAPSRLLNNEICPENRQAGGKSTAYCLHEHARPHLHERSAEAFLVEYLDTHVLELELNRARGWDYDPVGVARVSLRQV